MRQFYLFHQNYYYLLSTCRCPSYSRVWFVVNGGNEQNPALHQRNVASWRSPGEGRFTYATVTQRNYYHSISNLNPHLYFEMLKKVPRLHSCINWSVCFSVACNDEFWLHLSNLCPPHHNFLSIYHWYYIYKTDILTRPCRSCFPTPSFTVLQSTSMIGRSVQTRMEPIFHYGELV